MDQNNQGTFNKHYKPFWPLFIITLVGVIFAGIVLLYIFNDSTQDQINSYFTVLSGQRVPKHPVNLKK